MKGSSCLTHDKKYVKAAMISYDLFTKRELIERCILLENELLKLTFIDAQKNVPCESTKILDTLRKRQSEKKCMCIICTLGDEDKKCISKKTEEWGDEDCPCDLCAGVDSSPKEEKENPFSGWTLRDLQYEMNCRHSEYLKKLQDKNG
jgi:hypothetical protein